MGPGPDKILEDLLKAKITFMMTNNAIFDGLLYEYSADIIKTCRDHFRAHPPTAKLGYARTSDRWPVWAILLTGKRPMQEYIGRSGGLVESGGATYQRYTSVRAPSISVWVYSENADVTRWHSDIVEGLIDMSVKELLAQVEEFAFAGAQDLTPEQAYAPENLWVRAQTWDFVKSQMVLRNVTELVDTLTAPPYVGVEGEDLGDGVVGAVEPYSDR
jgi:hypothetical protein